MFSAPQAAMALTLAIAMAAPLTAAQPANEPVTPEELVAIDVTVDAAFADLMRPGPRQEGWEKGGVDVFAILAAAPGGASRHFLLSVDKNGDRQVKISGTSDLDAHAPKAWKKLREFGTPSPSDVPRDVTFGQFEKQFYFVGSDGRRRSGDALCSVGPMFGQFYEFPERQVHDTLPLKIFEGLFEQLAKRLQDRTICWRYDSQGEGYRVSYFLEDGRTLPAMTAHEEYMTIMPAGSIEQMLQPTAP